MKDKSQEIIHKRDGSNCCEFEFVTYYQSISNECEDDVGGMEVQRSAYRGHNVISFSSLMKSNSEREVRVDLVN